MTDKDSNLTENLANEIESAVDDLFGRYELSQGGGSKAAPEPEPPEPAAPEPELDLSLESEPEEILDLTMDEPVSSPPAPKAPPPRPAAPTPTPPPAAPAAAVSGTADIIAEMEEAILTVDWEVNGTNVNKARSILDRLRDDLNLAATPAEEVAALMDMVLRCMAESPGNAPTSGPAHLKDGLAAIKACVENNGAPGREGRQLLVKAVQSLQDSLPLTEKNGVLDLAADKETDFALELESAAEVKAEEPISRADLTVPIGMERVLKEYQKNLDRALRRLTLMDDLFGRTPGMEKLHRLTSRVRENLRKLQKEIHESFLDDFTRATGTVAAGGDLSTFLNEHRSILDYCVNRLVPMENLFEKNSGYEKLYKLTKKIRIRLEREQSAIERAMSGDYEPGLADVMSSDDKEAREAPVTPAVPDDAKLTPKVAETINECIKVLDDAGDGDLVKTLAAVARAKKMLAGIQGVGFDKSTTPPAAAAGVHNTCPWPILMKTVWGGRTVAFAPEQVAYQSPKKIHSRRAAKTSFFSLKTLKPSPWTNLKDMVSGELANEPGKILKKMEFPVMRPPTDFPGSAMKKQVMILLYKNGLGKACFLDAPMEPMNVPEEAEWEELVDTETGLAGTLTVSGEEIPVYAI